MTGYYDDRHRVYVFGGDGERVALTPRQVQLLFMIAAGLSSVEIGRRLGDLTEDTIKTHRQRLYRRLRARNAPHAVHVGHTLGVFRLPPVRVFGDDHGTGDGDR